jgi:hypothetical protein
MNSERRPALCCCGVDPLEKESRTDAVASREAVCAFCDSVAVVLHDLNVLLLIKGPPVDFVLHLLRFRPIDCRCYFLILESQRSEGALDNRSSELGRK